MKQSSLLVLLIICFFQVHFTLSDENSWNEQFKTLNNLRKNVDEAKEKLNLHVQRQYNTTFEELHKLARSFMGIISKVALSVLDNIKTLKSSGVCNDNNRTCVQTIYRDLLKLISEDNNSLLQRAEDEIKNLTEDSELYKFQKNSQEISEIIDSESNRNTSSCLKKSNYSYFASETCLIYKILRVQLFLRDFNDKEQNLEKDNVSFDEKLTIKNNLLNSEHLSFLMKIRQVENSFTTCISKNCKVFKYIPTK